jgi:hypothetical protein
MPGIEFLQAFAKFYVDKSEFEKGLKEAPSQADSAAKKIEESFKGAMQRGFSGGTDALESLSGVAGRAASIITNPLLAVGAAGVAVAAALADGVSQAIEFDREFTKIAVLLGDNAEKQAEVRAQIESVGGSLEKVKEFAAAYRNALINTGSTEAANEIAKVGVALSKVADSDAVRTTQLIGDLLDGLGKKSDEAADLAGKLFFLMKSGGGDVSELGGGFQTLVDTTQTLGIPFEHVIGLLSRLGDVAGASPQRNIQSLNIALGALESHKSKLLEEGLDLDAAIKAEGALGAIKVLAVATDGSREGLREFGIQGRNANAILKLIEDAAGDAGDALKTKFAEAGVAGASDLDQALAIRSQSISTQIRKAQGEIEAIRRSGGQGLLDLAQTGRQALTDFFNPALAKDASLETVSERLEEIEAARERLKEQGSKGFIAEATTGLSLLQPEYEALLKRKALLEATADVERRKAEIAERGNQTSKESEALTRQLAASEEARAAQAARLSGELGLSVEELKKLDPEMTRAEALAEASRKAFTELGVLAEETFQKEIQRETASLTNALQTNLQIAESERALEVARADVEGRQVDGLEELLARKRQVIEESAAAELQAIDEVAASQRRAADERIEQLQNEADLLRSRPGFETNFQLRQKAVGLDTELAKAQDALANLEADADAKRLARERKLLEDLAALRKEDFERRRANIVRNQRLDDESFQHLVATGQATIQVEIDRLKLLALDPERTHGERLKFAEQARTRERQDQQQELDFRRLLGEATLQDEIAFQQRLVDAARQGTQERRDLERKLADDVRSFRQQAASTAGTLFDQAATAEERRRNAGLETEIARLRERIANPELDDEQKARLNRRIAELQEEKTKPVELTKGLVTEEAERLRREAQENARRFGAGGAITREEFGAIGKQATLDEQLTQFGGGLQGANVALEQFARNLSVPFGEDVRRRIGGESPLTLRPGDDRETQLIKFNALADLATLRREGLDNQLGALTGLEGSPGRRETLGSGPTLDQIANGFERGLEGAQDPGNVEGFAASLGRSLYRRVYDQLVTDLQREAERTLA